MTGDGVKQGTLAANIDRMANADTGLELRKWALIDQPPRLQNALTRHADEWSLPPADLDQLRRNGMRMLRIPVSELALVRSELEPLVGSAEAWHGNAFQWRDIQDIDLAEGSVTVAVDGRVARFADGQFRLLARCWTLPTEDGAKVQLELVPQFNRKRARDYRAILGETPSTGRHFPSLALDMRLESGFVYILAFAPPDAVWTLGAEAPTETLRTPTTRAYGPDSMIGPGAPAPLTIGELLLSGDGTSGARQLLVFVPRVPDSLQPQDSLADGVQVMSEATTTQ